MRKILILIPFILFAGKQIHPDDLIVSWEKRQVVNKVTNTQSIIGSKIPCEEGYADGYPCKGVDLLSFLSPQDLGGTDILNDIWGWTDSQTGNEFALVGLLNGTSFVDVTDPVNPVVLGLLPTHTISSIWRDIKVYNNYAYVVSENAGNHGVQIFDLTLLRDVTEFTTFSETSHYDLIGSAHNIFINEKSGFAYVVGVGSAATSDKRCNGGSHIMDLSDPVNPVFAGCFAHKGTGRSGTGYSHDIQVVIYGGPDSDYVGNEIAFSSNETALSIADVSDKSNPIIISKYDVTNAGSRYIHQGWLSEDQKYFFVNDELNELRGLDDTQNTLIFDVSDLDNPRLVSIYESTLTTIDHNNYVVDSLLYQSNYSAGLRILSIRDPLNPGEVAFFDTYPAGDIIDFVGSWSNYPFFKSRTIVVSSIEGGLFVLKLNNDVDLATKDEISIPDRFELKQNFPNPFNPVTQIQYDLPKSGNVTIKLFNTLGTEVMTLVSEFKTAGTHFVTLNGTHLPSGIYFYQLRSGDFVKTRKMSLLK
ncbi:MAG: choice-of-anchor B family protein [Candidatus Marinimicrobia bacterium]|nr:choice-of-anchor B family protein [Candidatus Neomarinimicrobiota bacterium]MBL7010399.1 choice-of-anchor B family protein [Candidatus Neomarinimicrobiota bacterium]MBL7030840.1 choice-of-anchor B family protein [Candidatus Neomarinimicrobiota bacterium]